jgi:hypothetical protein
LELVTEVAVFVGFFTVTTKRKEPSKPMVTEFPEVSLKSKMGWEGDLGFTWNSKETPAGEPKVIGCENSKN